MYGENKVFNGINFVLLVIVIMGFMVLGKIGLVFDIVVKVESEVISVDLVFVYKGMDIGIVKLM